MHLNVLHTDRAGHAMHLVDLPHIVIDVLVGGQGAHVALEVHHIHLVESHQGHKQSQIRLGEGSGGSNEARVAKNPFHDVQRCDENIAQIKLLIPLPLLLHTLLILLQPLLPFFAY